jgi:hypothetical protein
MSATLTKPWKLGKAPISDGARSQLKKDASDIAATAARKGLALDPFELRDEQETAKAHFELGCWLYRYTKIAPVLGRDEHLKERIDLVERLIMTGFNNPVYSFQTVFDFGERDFDDIFENFDGEAVKEGLRQKIKADTTGMLLKGFMHFGWRYADKPESPLSLKSSITTITPSTTLEQAVAWRKEVESLYTTFFDGETYFKLDDMHECDCSIMVELTEIEHAAGRPPVDIELVSGFTSPDWRDSYTKAKV